MRALTSWFSFAFALLFAARLQAGIIFTEDMAPGGIFSLDNLNPTNLPTLMVGINRVRGSLKEVERRA